MVQAWDGELVHFFENGSKMKIQSDISLPLNVIDTERFQMSR